MTPRKIFLIALVLGIPLVPLRADAQGRPARIGILGPSEEPRFSELMGGLKQGLRDHGYSGAALEILEARVARGDGADIAAAVERVLARRAALLFVIGSESARLVRQSSPEVPIVFITPGDPVAAGLVSSLAHPGGNMTAVTFEYPELSGKRLQLVKEMVPRVRRALVLFDPRDASPKQGILAVRGAAPKLGITLVEREIRSREEITKSLEVLSGVDALLAVPGGLTSTHYEEVIREANARKIPTMVHARTKSTMAALASYGASDAEIARQAARLVDKILKGANAGDIPVERPTKLDLVINLKTGRALGLTIPQSVLLRADQVIQ